MITTRPGYPRWHTASAQGPRSLNADAVGAYAAAGGPGIAFALADGVGDDPTAARAARTAAAAAARTPVHKGPVEAVLAAQRAVREQTLGDAVLVVAMPAEHGGYRIAWVGDARAYAWDGTTLSPLTTDHTLAEFFRARHQPVTPRMEHVVTTSVRTAEAHEIGTAETTSAGLLLTSDGIHKPLTGSGIRAVLAQPGTGAAELVEAALARGGSDNATALYVEPLEAADNTTVRFPIAA
ncbi:serine/threonine protein phosphatase [Amycolatopsis mediterranei S699]|uniref:Serine/threonine protein phosphatase n=2 Tax=Amycolatopsis mediterranei TaxID=33910 RepID=A0A0H3DE29_AMYMU|nr:serine/threonine protein phosphatase [Amycolatopsis mediterranei]ADJ48487.1 serine/threonine protein phosphatase [Amycolatopsis mediterranei U32]AEK45411.1 serine/threonine protein phosphatase [Amycolatopsis mediterranei S699]AFO80198.1 serine/threonine protein phosphatase [Amycolatopsis mediterranei S699]AGT87326.1 serine/threonine protein phosphatase [Amycolatopsis mediterranei RB]KDO11005.1 serine/threonine protein phosphatase [Amycolatopsis mediterranei]